MRKPASAPGSDPGKPSDSPEAIDARLEEMERKIERLRSMYETFFSGIERRPPNIPRRDLNRMVLEMQQIHIRNAAQRFRFQSLSQKWTLLTTYWNRTMREIEAGTYRKDLARVSRRLAEKGTPLSEQEAIALGIPMSRARALIARQEATRRARPNAGATVPASNPAATLAPPAAAPAPTGGAGFGDADLEALARRYDAAARGLSGDRSPPPLEKIRAMLAKKVPELLAQPGAAGLSFDVAVKDGRVVLRASRTPKSSA